MSEKQQSGSRQASQHAPRLYLVGQQPPERDPHSIEAELQGFYRRRRARVLEYLRGARPRTGDLAAHEFVDRIHNEWRQQFATRELPDTDPVERTFWFALFLIEELELVRGLPREQREPPSEPRFDFVKTELRYEMLVVADLLEDGEPLPPEHFASRPGERGISGLVVDETWDSE